MTGALTGSELETLVFVVGVLVLLGAAYVAYVGRHVAAAIIAVIGVVLLLLAS